MKKKKKIVDSTVLIEAETEVFHSSHLTELSDHGPLLEAHSFG